MLQIIFRVGALLLIFGGFFALLIERCKIPAEFAPAIVCAGISSALVLAGILNILILTTAAISAGGAVCLALYGSRLLRRGQNRRSIAIVIGWMIAAVLLTSVVYGRHFTSYDNFSHWATVVRSMLLHNRIPNIEDEMVTFQAYPLGSAVFLYYVCKVAGQAEGVYLLGQGILSISFLLPLFVFAKRKATGFLCLLFSLFALTYNVTIYELLVDTVMPLAGISVLCVLYAQTNSTGEENWPLWVAPLNIFLINVKSSGVFFVAANCFFFFLLYREHWRKDRRFAARYLFYDLLLPTGALYLWKQHVTYAFPGGNISKHALSVTNYLRVFSEKNREDIIKIASDIADYVFSITDPLSLVFLFAVGILLIIGAGKAVWHQSRHCAVAEAAAGVILYGVYIFFVFCMYVFSMPAVEAEMLACYDRYVKTILIYLCGFAMIVTLRAAEKQGGKWICLMCLLWTLPLLSCGDGLKQTFTKQDYPSTRRYAFEQLLSGESLPPNGRYVLYSNEEDYGDMHAWTTYELYTGWGRITECNAQTLDGMIDSFPNYDRIIVWSVDEKIEAYMRQQGVSGRVFQAKPEQ